LWVLYFWWEFYGFAIASLIRRRLGHSVEVSGLLLCGIKHDTERYLRRNNVCGCYPALSGAKMVCLREESYHTSPVIGKFFMGSRHLSSLVNEKSCNENILKETVLELEKFLSAKVNGDINLDEEVEQEFESEPSRLDDPLSEYANDLYLGCREPLKRKTSLELLRTVMNSPAPYLPGILKKFAEAVEHLSHLEASKIVFILWKHHMYYKALKVLSAVSIKLLSQVFCIIYGWFHSGR